MKELFRIRLKALRKENLKTQQDMANLLDIGRSTYAEYERGQIEPSASTIDTLANYFNVSADYLLGNTNFKTDDQKVEAPKDVMDISKQLNLLLDFLHDNSSALTIDGEVMDEDSRDLIASSIENSLKIAQRLNKKG